MTPFSGVRYNIRHGTVGMAVAIGQIQTYKFGLLISTRNNFNMRVYPVLSLKSDTVITSGDGTEANPYVVE